jgi:hypothetical protein
MELRMRILYRRQPCQYIYIVNRSHGHAIATESMGSTALKHPAAASSSSSPIELQVLGDEDDNEQHDSAETDALLVAPAGAASEPPVPARRRVSGDSLRHAVARYSTAAEEQPFQTASLTCAVLLGASDLTEQLLIERRPWAAFDGAVVIAVVVYGIIYNGPMNVIIYRMYDRVYSEKKLGRAVAVGAKVATDQLVSSPFIYTPGYYIITGLVRLHPPPEIWKTLQDAWFPVR